MKTSLTFLLFFCAFNLQITEAQVYLDSTAAIDERVTDLLNRMTLEEKIGQMTQVDRRYLKNESDIQTYFIGSILSGGGSAPTDNSPNGWADMYDRFQSEALSTRLKIPVIYGIDAVHGHNNVKGAVIFPHNIGLGCTRNSVLVEQAERITAMEVAGTGIDWTFGPCIAVPQDERWGRTYEGFGETPELVSMMSAAAVTGFQGNDLSDPITILACAKHYVGDGGTTGGDDQGNTEVNEQTLRTIHLPGYISAIDVDVGSIMASFSSWNGQKVHGSHYLLTTVLKQELEFNGFVVSDWAGIDQLPSDYTSDVETAINAGIDMVMVPDKYEAFISACKTLVQNGKISMERINDAVRRILRKKFKLGLFERSYTNRNLTTKIGSQQHREVARQCVRESLVLLKKKDGILPLQKHGIKIHVAGKSANNLGYQCGGWTISWGGGSGQITEGTTILQAIRNTAVNSQIFYSMNGSGATSADVGIVVIGETPYAEGAGDKNDLGLSKEDIAAVRRVKNAGIPTVVILISGRPMIIKPIWHDCDVFIAAWLPGTEGQGVADILFGDYQPSGKLSYSWPKEMSQIPINFGDENYDPLFEYGYGITSLADSPQGSPPVLLSARVTEDGTGIEATFNKKMADPADDFANFSLLINQVIRNLTSAKLKETDSTTIILNAEGTIEKGDTVFLSYSAGEIMSGDGGLLASFENKEVYNILNESAGVHIIPGRMEAEEYSNMSGIQTQETTDEGGGYNVGWIDQNDWLEYTVHVQQSGTYTLYLRIASQSISGTVHIMKNGANIGSINLPVTGGWQNWQTVETSIQLEKGRQTIRLFVVHGGFNLNWLEFSFVTSVRDDDYIPVKNQLLQNYPNPFNPTTRISYFLENRGSVKIYIFNTAGQIVFKNRKLHKNPGKYSFNFDASHLPAGNYFCRIRTADFMASRKMLLIK